MKEYTVEFEDVVKYKFKIMAEDEHDAKRIVSRMETYEFANYEVDRNEHTPTKVINDEMECNICSIEEDMDKLKIALEVIEEMFKETNKSLTDCESYSVLYSTEVKCKSLGIVREMIKDKIDTGSFE